jgi:dTDP-4-dehydrorhamnose reductase
MNKKILVIGGSGIIGYNLVKEFTNEGENVEFTYFKNQISLKNSHELDASLKDDTIEFICKINPDIIIQTVALAGVDLAEKNHKLADQITVNSTENIIQGCKLTKSKLVYVSTTYVFDGNKQIFKENDIPIPKSYYGITKLRAEKIIQNSNLKYLILRTDQPYFWIKKGQRMNSVIRVLNTLKNKSVLNEIIDWYNMPTYVPDFVKATKILINNDEEGIFHITGPDFVNRYTWSLKVAEIFGLDKKLINPIVSDKLSLAIKRDNINVNNEKIHMKTGIKMRGINEGLSDMFKHRIEH